MDLNSEGPIGLKEFLSEAELQHYFEHFRENLKINKTTQLKFVLDEDLIDLGLSKPEQRRYKKVYTKYFGKQYFSKIKRLLSSAKKSDNMPVESVSSIEPPPLYESPVKVPTKHIIPVEDITINKELGTGEFGVVQQGTWTNDNKRIQVAIKCLGRDRMQSNSMEFLKEAAVMHSIDHPHVVRLYGVVLHPDSLMLVTELAPLRSLLECLKEFTLRQNFPVLTLCNFAEQICDGMTYLEKKRLIHRDLAARNILVFNKNRVKISDFGLSRALGVGKDYYQTNYNVNLKLPVAWCAVECITYLKFTTASDVWAYAVTLWEMFSYGFQPWAAFSGHQILTAIDEPNYQRLERPECCPEQYYAMMLDCWAHEPADRPNFTDLRQRLIALRPQQMTATAHSPKVEGRRSNLLIYRTGDVITVVGQEYLTKSEMWCGVLNNGACGLFDPSTTTPVSVSSSSSVPHGTPGGSKTTGGLLTSTLRSSLLRSDSKRHTYTGKRSIQRSMISGPQGEVVHTGHVGLDGAYFGNISFLDPSNLVDTPRQIVYPYRPSEDLEEMPLINPSSPSHLTAEASSSLPYPMMNSLVRQNPATCAASLGTNQDEVDDSNLGLGSYCKTSKRNSKSAGQKFISKVKSATLGKSFRPEDNLPSSSKPAEGAHEYHEISDDNENRYFVTRPVPPDSPGIHKSHTDFSQSILQEMETMFQGLSGPTSNQAQKQADSAQRASTLGKKRPHLAEIVKPMSAHEQKTLETAVAMANELTAKSMNDLDSKVEKAALSPTERNKFHFKFPTLGHNQHPLLDQVKEVQGKQERRNFSQEAQSVPDIQSSITEESRLAYASLIEQPTPSACIISQIAQVGNILYNQPGCIATQLKPPGTSPRPPSWCSVEYEGKPPSYHANAELRPPLPPKGGKPPLVDKTRHQRKYPLVMNDSTRAHLQAVSVSSHIEDRNGRSVLFLPTERTHEYQNFLDSQPVHVKNECRVYVNNLSNGQSHSEYTAASPERIYQNIPVRDSVDVFDGPSLYFEKNIEQAVCVVDKDSSKLKAWQRNTLAKPTDMKLQLCTSYDNDGSLMKDSPDHVSVEDLLEFAGQKPRGSDRGAESDEVRILCKVLRDKVSESECLEALEHSEWNVHASLKLIRIQLALNHEVPLGECAHALEAGGGDLARAIAIIHKQSQTKGG